jgi:hypothetical protein
VSTATLKQQRVGASFVGTAAWMAMAGAVVQFVQGVPLAYLEAETPSSAAIVALNILDHLLRMVGVAGLGAIASGWSRLAGHEWPEPHTAGLRGTHWGGGELAFLGERHRSAVWSRIAGSAARPYSGWSRGHQDMAMARLAPFHATRLRRVYRSGRVPVFRVARLCQ